MSNDSLMEITLFGDWAGAQRFIKNLAPNIRASVLYGQKKAAEQIVKAVKGHIRDQKPPDGVVWEPLSASTINRKGHSDYFIDTLSYYDSIEVWREAYTYYCGVKRGVKNKQGVEISYIANILEFGTNKIPSRALWGPVIDQTPVNKIVMDVLEKKLRLEALSTFKINKLNNMFG